MKESYQKKNERFEIMAELFRMHTSYLAPGKSVPPELDSESYRLNRDVAWHLWNDEKALDETVHLIQDMRDAQAHVEYERDNLRLRIKAVDEEHELIKEERKKMLAAYTALEVQKNFWEREHKALMETCHNMQRTIDELRERDRVQNEELGKLGKERGQLHEILTIRGKALEQPCLACGYTEKAIRPQNGGIP